MDPTDSWKGIAISRSMYVEMRRIARGVLARYPAGESAQPSSLVHEAIYKLRRYGPSRWANQRHFMNVARRAMGQVLIDRIRARKTPPLVTLENANDVSAGDTLIDEMLTFEQAIAELERLDARFRSIVAGKAVHQHPEAEIARELELSVRSVQRMWRFARAFIASRLDAEGTLSETRSAGRARSRTTRTALHTKGSG